MKIYVQWTTKPAEGWKQYDHKDWSLLPKLPDPTGKSMIIKKTYGWIFRLECQGIVFHGYDCYSVESMEDNVQITGWNINSLAMKYNLYFMENTKSIKQICTSFKGDKFADFVPTSDDSLIRYGISTDPKNQANDPLFLNHIKENTFHYKDWIGDPL